MTVDFPWDNELYEKLKAENEEELETFQKEEDEAAESAGDTEVQAARGKRAEFWARVGDKVCLYIATRARRESTDTLTSFRKKHSHLMKLSSTRQAYLALESTSSSPSFALAFSSVTDLASRRISTEPKP